MYYKAHGLKLRRTFLKHKQNPALKGIRKAATCASAVLTCLELTQHGFLKTNTFGVNYVISTLADFCKTMFHVCFHLVMFIVLYLPAPQFYNYSKSRNT